MSNTYVREKLFSLRDEKYREFNIKLIPTVSPETVIGVRTPDLRLIAKEIWKDGGAYEFMSDLPHKYYEENNIHAFLTERINDFDKTVEELDRFLPYVDNWATCDQMNPKIFKKHTDELLPVIKRWLSSGETYTVRFALGALMSCYLDDHFTPEINSIAASVKSDEYYINMMQSWYFATALAKRYDETITFIEDGKLSPWVHNKAIQKSVESRRIDDKTKNYLKTLKT